MPFLPFPAPPLHTHTRQWKRHGTGTWRQDRACSKQAGHSLFHVCYWKCKRTCTRALTVLPVLLLKDMYGEHQKPLWSFRSRPFSTAITWVDKGIPEANHSPSSLLWTRLFSGRWKFKRNTTYLQAFPQRWFQQLHAEGSTLCAPAAQLAWPSFLFCLPWIILFKLRGEKEYGHERIWLSGFSKNLKNNVQSTWVEIGLSSALEFMVLFQDWGVGHFFECSTYQSKKIFLGK